MKTMAALFEKIDQEDIRQMREWSDAIKEAHLGKPFFVRMHDGVFGQFLLNAKGSPVYSERQKDARVEVRQGPFVLSVEWDIEEVLVDAILEESGDLSERVTISHEAFLRNPKSELQKAEAALYKKTAKWPIEEGVRVGSSAIVEWEAEVKNGWAYDDEGNRTYVGTHVRDGQYGLSDFSKMTRASRGSSYGGNTSSKQTSPDISKMMAAVDRAIEYEPDNKFLKSVRDQMSKGRSLSSKQKAVVKKILTKLGGTVSAKLFEGMMLERGESSKAIGTAILENLYPGRIRRV